MFKNPLVFPDILGVSNGAGLGAALALTLGLSNFMVQVYAFVFGILVVSLAYFIGSHAKFGHDVSLVLAGSMLGALSSSFITLLKYIADPNDTLPAITFWLMGSLSKVTINSFVQLDSNDFGLYYHLFALLEIEPPNIGRRRGSGHGHRSEINTPDRHCRCHDYQRFSSMSRRINRVAGTDDSPYLQRDREQIIAGYFL